MYVWGAAQRGAPVQVNVIGTMMFLVALIVVIIGQVLSSRRERARA
jgi:spermidine/putrescine transport system permease protein